MAGSTSGFARKEANDDVARLSRRFRRIEIEFVLLVSVVSVVFFSRLTEPGLRGEETRRAQVAVEMMTTGDWIVPRQQGKLFFSRPPFQNWLIAAVGYLRGDVDVFAIRFPCALATLLTSLLIYGYARRWMSPAAALVAGLAFATMGHVLELGRLGETEALYTLLVAGSLLLWHWGDSSGRRPVTTWVIAYVLVALGMLTKGPQAPAYFAGSIGLFLLVSRRWRDIITWPHVTGILTFVVLWSAWQIPYMLEAGAEAGYRIHHNDVAMRFEDTSWTTVVEHLVVFPLEILVCLLPWSALLGVFCWPSFWRSLGRSRTHVIFLLCCLAATFPTCWFVPGAKTRYFMPLYPCVALLIGVAAEQCWNGVVTMSWDRAWKRFLRSMSVIMVLLGLAAPLLTFFPPAEHLTQSLSFSFTFAVASWLLAAVCWWSRAGDVVIKRCAGAVVVAAFLGLVYMGLITNCQVRASSDVQQQIAELKQRLGPNASLVSLGMIDHCFTYYFEQPIRPISPESWPESADYFCFGAMSGGDQPQLEFPWQPVGSVTCDRTHDGTPKRQVIVARRLDAPERH